MSFDKVMDPPPEPKDRAISSPQEVSCLLEVTSYSTPAPPHVTAVWPISHCGLVSPVPALHVNELHSVHSFESGFTHVCEVHLCCCGCQQCAHSGSRAFSCMYTPRCVERRPGCWGWCIVMDLEYDLFP